MSLLSPIALTKAQWGCHGSEAMAILFMKFTYKILERISNDCRGNPDTRHLVSGSGYGLIHTTFDVRIGRII
jgi:hypothetical protein